MIDFNYQPQPGLHLGPWAWRWKFEEPHHWQPTLGRTLLTTDKTTLGWVIFFPKISRRFCEKWVFFCNGDVQRNVGNSAFWCQKFKAKIVSGRDSKSAERWEGFMCQDINAKWRSLAALIRRIGRVNLDVGTFFSIYTFGGKIVKYDGRRVQKSGSRIQVSCFFSFSDIRTVMGFPHVSSCVLSVGNSSSKTGINVFHESSWGFFSVWHSSDDSTGQWWCHQFQYGKCHMYSENCAKIWVHLSTSLGFFPGSSIQFNFAAGNCEPLAVSRRTMSVLRILKRHHLMLSRAVSAKMVVAVVVIFQKWKW